MNMKHFIFIFALMLTCISMNAQGNRPDGERRPLTEEQIAEMHKRQAERVKKSLELTADQEAKFSAEYDNYANIVMATRSSQFKNRASRPNSAEEAVATINNSIDSQLVELAAKKQMITNLKDVLTAEQLMKLNAFTSGFGMAPNPNRDGQNSNRRGQRRGGNFGGFGGGPGFGGGDFGGDD